MTNRAWLIRASCLVALSAAACGGVTLGAGDAGPTSGSAGTTGAAGSTSTGVAGTTGSAGTGGGAGSNGGAGTGGKAGSGGGAGTTGAAGASGCGPVCDIYCAYGNETDARGCALCKCKPAPACTSAECGAPSAAAPYCPGGQIVPGTCARNTDGKCAWTPTQCITSCPTLACPPIFCPYGMTKDANGCATCQCNSCPSGTHSVGCPKILCTLDCADGYERTSTGCIDCKCRAPAACAPPNALCAFCPYGYRKGPNGCASCACEAPPAGCGFDAMDAN